MSRCPCYSKHRSGQFQLLVVVVVEESRLLQQHCRAHQRRAENGACVEEMSGNRKRSCACCGDGFHPGLHRQCCVDRTCHRVPRSPSIAYQICSNVNVDAQRFKGSARAYCTGWKCTHTRSSEGEPGRGTAGCRRLLRFSRMLRSRRGPRLAGALKFQIGKLALGPGTASGSGDRGGGSSHV